MRRIFNILFPCLIFAGNGHFLQAQENDNIRTYTLDEIVVTAQPIIEGNSVTKYGESVTTVSDRQIDDLNAQDKARQKPARPGPEFHHEKASAKINIR